MTVFSRIKVMGMLTKICALATLSVFFVSCKSTGPEAHSSLVVVNSIGMPMRYIEAGTFMMGSTSKLAASDEYPILKTTIDHPFYIGVYEVTRADWIAVMGGMDADAAHEKHDVYADAPAAKSKSPRHPIDNVSWLEAKEFCQRLSEKEGKTYRLPTEAEWEYACRAGSTTDFYWGDTFNLRYAWADENSESHSHPVGQKLPNAWGLYDMAGNQMEWCENIYKYKRAGTAQKNIRGEDEFKLIKGGGWTFLGKYCRSARRLRDHQSVRESKYGFRVVCLTDKRYDNEFFSESHKRDEKSKL